MPESYINSTLMSNLARFGCLDCSELKTFKFEKEIKMPKLKTHSGAKKRFKVSHTGKVTGRSGWKRHRLVSKSKKAKRDGKATNILSYMDARVVLDYFLPFAKKKRRNKKVYIAKKEAA